MKFAITVAAALLASVATGAGVIYAAEPPREQEAASRPDMGTLAAADRLLTAMDYDRMMRRMADSAFAQTGPALKQAIEAQTGQPVDDELIRRVQAAQASFVRANLVDNPRLRRDIATLYARHFTTAELDRLAAIYGDPIMRKWTEVSPAMMSDMMPLLIEMLEAGRDDLRKQLEDIVRDYSSSRSNGSRS